VGPETEVAPFAGPAVTIVLECAEGLDNTEVARVVGVHQATVGKWRRRFIERRLDGLVDEPRPGHRARSATTTWSESW
jgi:transposase